MKAINLLPPDLRRAPSSAASKAAADEPAGFGAFAVLGALAVCVVALAAYVLTTNTVKDRQAKLETITAEAQTTSQRVNQLKPFADFQAMAETRIQTVRDLASSRFDWEQALRDISRAIPADVTLTALNGTITDGAGGSGTGGGSTVRSAIAAPAIQLTGCTRSQREVATLLSRLRSVDGVTRVSLGKSLKPAPTAATGPTAAVAPTATTQTGCPGRSPSFELVIFFERSEVPASVQDITVQPSAAPSRQPANGGSQSGTSRPAVPDSSTPPAETATDDPVVTGPTKAGGAE
jgi:Tfp pilus assembly protein PilN